MTKEAKCPTEVTKMSRQTFRLDSGDRSKLSQTFLQSQVLPLQVLNGLRHFRGFGLKSVRFSECLQMLFVY